MASKIILVTGGARSGKSRFAEQYVAKHGKEIAYIATAQIYDDEMKLRVTLHKNRRPSEWTTYESPYNAEHAIMSASKKHDTILFDCLTLYTSNMLFAKSAPQKLKERYEYVKEHIEILLKSAKESNRQIIFVTNEVGMSIVPENALAREYRDLAGLVNQSVAATADEVYMVISGIAVDIKKISTKLEEEYV
jgi:adenosylcobinamide kinase/adenosylcobinamide-phosphate guanylyltransferase